MVHLETARVLSLDDVSAPRQIWRRMATGEGRSPGWRPAWIRVVMQRIQDDPRRARPSSLPTEIHARAPMEASWKRQMAAERQYIGVDPQGSLSICRRSSTSRSRRQQVGATYKQEVTGSSLVSPIRRPHSRITEGDGAGRKAVTHWRAAARRLTQRRSAVGCALGEPEGTEFFGNRVEGILLREGQFRFFPDLVNCFLGSFQGRTHLPFLTTRKPECFQPINLALDARDEDRFCRFDKLSLARFFVVLEPLCLEESPPLWLFAPYHQRCKQRCLSSRIRPG